MPFHLIQSVLAFTFALIWVFIGATLLRDALLEVRRARSVPGGAPDAGRSMGRRPRRRRRTRV
ncbi:hypothetical protein Mal64_38020 [Pseudobythopirellula maris]|uniref:Uncharacterized protein n=1 Tax=Pseudobythopirellula maris TaxID=2527991 RepID=A0A5C5ZG07_9BACT|nr:hypothetical protein [Pseudobythopirellula maris]TWT86262.1 hypothetical protein Mal64_38020 [Pseudobythopirellula maris]